MVYWLSILRNRFGDTNTKKFKKIVPEKNNRVPVTFTPMALIITAFGTEMEDETYRDKRSG